MLSEKKFLNDTKNHNPPPPLQVKWAVPYDPYVKNIFYKLYVNTIKPEKLYEKYKKAIYYMSLKHLMKITQTCTGK